MVFRLFAEMQSVQPAYDPTPVAIVTVGADVQSADLAALIEQARAVPGIVAVATMGREMKLIGVAVALAAAGTLAVTRFAFVELLRLSVKDPFFWLGILLALGVVSAVACYTAVRGISRLEPMDALRDL